MEYKIIGSIMLLVGYGLLGWNVKKFSRVVMIWFLFSVGYYLFFL